MQKAREQIPHPSRTFVVNFRKELRQRYRKLNGDKALIAGIMIARAISYTPYSKGTITNHALRRLGRLTELHRGNSLYD